MKRVVEDEGIRRTNARSVSLTAYENKVHTEGFTIDPNFTSPSL